MTAAPDTAPRVPPSTFDIPLRWADMDAYGHVNNATYMTLVEQARILALSEWFGDDGLLESGIVVSNQETDYVAQLAYREAPVTAVVWCSHVGASSFTMAWELRDPVGVGEVRYCLGETTLVRFDAAAGHSRRLGERDVEVLRAHLGDPAPLYRRRRKNVR